MRTSVGIEKDGKFIVVDTGPDFRQQMLRLQPARLDAVLFTHSHKDHISGFDDIRAFNFMQKEAIDVFLENNVMDAIKRDFFYMFEDFKYPGIPEANFKIIDESRFDIEKIKIDPIRVWHFKMPVLGFRIDNFAYITDANKIEAKEMEKLKDLDVLVLNALRKEKHISHFSLDEALEKIAEIKPGKAYLTHLSHQMGKHDDISLELPENVYLAYDELSIVL